MFGASGVQAVLNIVRLAWGSVEAAWLLFGAISCSGGWVRGWGCSSEPTAAALGLAGLCWLGPEAHSPPSSGPSALNDLAAGRHPVITGSGHGAGQVSGLPSWEMPTAQTSHPHCGIKPIPFMV